MFNQRGIGRFFLLCAIVLLSLVIGWVNLEAFEAPEPTNLSGTVIIVESATITPAYGGGMCDSYWFQFTNNRGYPVYLTLNTNDPRYSTNYGVWRPNLPAAGKYKIEAYIADHEPINWQCPSKRIDWDTSDARYEIVRGQNSTIAIGNQSGPENEWIDLGTHTFDAGTGGYVKLSDLNSEAHISHTVSFSAMRFTLVNNEPPPSGTIVEDPNIHPTYGNGMCDSAWFRFANNRGHNAYLTLNTNDPKQSTNWADWRPNLPAQGQYKVEAYVADHNPVNWQCPTLNISWDTSQARYTIHHASGVATVDRNQAPLTNAWSDLGTYSFNAGTGGWVELRDLNTEANLSHTVSFSAMRFTLVSSNPPPPPPPPPSSGDTVVVPSESAEYTPALGSVCNTGWHQWSYGIGGHGVVSLNAQTSSQSTNRVKWRPSITREGWYHVEAYIPNHPAFQWPCGSYRISWDTAKATYKIHNAQNDAIVTVNQSTLANQWTDLGVHYFTKGTNGYIELSDLTGEAFASHWISVDDMRFTFVSDDKVECLRGTENGGICNAPTVCFGGRVTDAKTKKPIPNVSVGFSRIATQTDGQGYYQVYGTNLSPAGEVLRFSRDGYKPVTVAKTPNPYACLSANVEMQPTRTGFLYAPLELRDLVANHPYDLYFDQMTDLDGGRIVSYNGIQGYYKPPVELIPGTTEYNVVFVEGKVTDYCHSEPYDWKPSVKTGPGRAYNQHEGTDFIAKAGDEVYAAASGKVLWNTRDPKAPYSGSVGIQHSDEDRTATAYVHIVPLPTLIAGSPVQRGQIIGHVYNWAANTHLHFSVRLNANSTYWFNKSQLTQSPLVDPYSLSLWASDSGVSYACGLRASASGSDVESVPNSQLRLSSAYGIGGTADITFDGSYSIDSDGSITEYIWDFGDGVLGAGITTTHRYESAGTYYAYLSVFDDDGNVGFDGPYPIVVHDNPPVVLSNSMATIMVLQGQTTERSIELSSVPKATFNATWSGEEVSVTLKDPEGFVITPETTNYTVTYSGDANAATYTLTDPLPGSYTIYFKNSDLTISTPVTTWVEVLDVKPPYDASVSLNTTGGPGRITGFTLESQVSDRESIVGMRMRFQVDQGNWSEWQPYTPSLHLPVDELDVVVVEFRDSSGNVSSQYTASTFFSPAPPDDSLPVPVIQDIGGTNGDYAVAWSSSTEAFSYELEERVDGGAWSTVYEGSQTNVVFADKNSGTWCYRVKAINTAGSSGWSDVECITVAGDGARYEIFLPAQSFMGGPD